MLVISYQEIWIREVFGSFFYDDINLIWKILILYEFCYQFTTHYVSWKFILLFNTERTWLAIIINFVLESSIYVTGVSVCVCVGSVWERCVMVWACMCVDVIHNILIFFPLFWNDDPIEKERESENMFLSSRIEYLFMSLNWSKPST